MTGTSPLSQSAPVVGSGAQVSLPTRPATPQPRNTDNFVDSGNAPHRLPGQALHLAPPATTVSQAPAVSSMPGVSTLDDVVFHMTLGKTEVERQASRIRSRRLSITLLFIELEEVLPHLANMSTDAQRSSVKALAEYVATKPQDKLEDDPPFLTRDIAAATAVLVHAEQAERVVWAHIDSLEPGQRARLLCMMSNVTNATIGGPIYGLAASRSEETSRPVELPTGRSPYEYYLGLVLSRHPNPGTRLRAQQYLQAHDGLCEHMDRQKTGWRDQLITSWWHDENSLVALRPSEADYEPLANSVPSDAKSGDPREVLNDMDFTGIRPSQLYTTLQRVCLQTATRRGLTLDPWEGSKAKAYVVGLDPKSFQYQADRFNYRWGLVDPSTHALPDTLANQARALGREHGSALSAKHPMVVRLRALAEEADRLDCESKADGAIWQQVVYLMQHDVHIGKLCVALQECEEQLSKLADERAFAARKAQADKALADLLADLEAETAAGDTKAKRKKKKPKSKPVDASQDVTDATPPANAAIAPQGCQPGFVASLSLGVTATPEPSAPAASASFSKPTRAASFPIEDAHIDQPSTRTVTVPSELGFQRVTHTPRRMVDLGAGVALPSRLSKAALKDLLERGMDPGTFVRSDEPLWRSAARSLAYHMRKHAAHSTAENYLAAARELYDRAYMNEVCRRADNPTQWIQQIRTDNWYAAYGWDGRVISLCNSRFCGPTHFPETRGVEATWPANA